MATPDQELNQTKVQSASSAGKIQEALDVEWKSLPSIPGYEITREIGRGGMGVVFEGYDSKLNRKVAIKIPLQASHLSPEDNKRFLIEAEAVAQLDHQNIIRLYEIGDTNGSPYFCMQLVTGSSLAARLVRAKQPKGSELRQLVSSVATIARALQHAHDRGVIHRDIKPSNILYDSDEVPYLADFGLAKRSYANDETLTSGAIGTPSYMAPEQTHGISSQITTRTDIYNLGAVLYEIVTGQPPYKRESSFATMKAIENEELTAPSVVNPRVDRELEAVCLKCLAKDPSQRYQSAAELAQDLESWQRGEPTKARPTSTFWQATLWAKRAIQSVSVVALMGILIGLLPVLILDAWLISIVSARMQVTPGKDQIVSERRTVIFDTMLTVLPSVMEHIYLFAVFSLIITFSSGYVIAFTSKSKGVATDVKNGLIAAAFAGMTALLFGILQIASLQDSWQISQEFGALARIAFQPEQKTVSERLSEYILTGPIGKRSYLEKEKDAAVAVDRHIMMQTYYNSFTSAFSVLPFTVFTYIVWCIAVCCAGGYAWRSRMWVVVALINYFDMVFSFSVVTGIIVTSYKGYLLEFRWLTGARRDDDVLFHLSVLVILSVVNIVLSFKFHVIKIRLLQYSRVLLYIFIVYAIIMDYIYKVTGWV